MHADMWATALPCDLLIDIFRRLGSTAIIRCAGVCRPWRRAIIDNARCFRPRPDRFLPDLLVAFLDYSCHVRQHTATLVPSAENNMLAALECVVDVGPEDMLALRDGFLLLTGNTMRNHSLCLCNLLAGSCRFLSAATVLGKSWFDPCSYVLTTAYDDDDDPALPDADGGAGGSSDVRILSVRGEENGVAYQTFSSTSGIWGPVKHSAKLVEEDLHKVCVQTTPRQAVVCGGGGGRSVVYWLVYLCPADEEADCRMCVVAMDTRTERTWTTELPKEWEDPFMALVLATSEDGQRLSLIAAQSQGPCHEIEVWVLASDSRWTLQQTMDVQSWLFPYSPHWGEIWLTGFCPRSGCLFAVAIEHGGRRQQFVIGVDGSSPRLMETAGNKSWFALPYEMDWSTYISKMKGF